jgi:hypothetical protein
MAAVLAAGDGALLSHQSQAENLGFRPRLGRPIEVTIPRGKCRAPAGLVIHRSNIDPAHIVERDGIPGVSVVIAMVQIAPRLPLGALERAINQADGLDLIDPESLRASLDDLGPIKGVRPLREALDRTTFAMSRSELERRFRPIAKRAGLPPPPRHARCVTDGRWTSSGASSGLWSRPMASDITERQRNKLGIACGIKLTKRPVTHPSGSPTARSVTSLSVWSAPWRG